MDLADGAAQAVSAQAAAEPTLAQAVAALPPPAIKEGCGLGLGDPDPDISGSVRQHAQPIGVDPKKPRATATVDDLAFFMLAGVFLFGLPALVYWSLGGSGLLATAGRSLHAAAEGLGGAVLIAQLVAVGVALAQRYQSRMPGYAEVPLWAMVTFAFFAVCAIQFFVSVIAHRALSRSLVRRAAAHRALAAGNLGLRPHASPRRWLQTRQGHRAGPQHTKCSSGPWEVPRHDHPHRRHVLIRDGCERTTQ
jgi:hypothetical protein